MRRVQLLSRLTGGLLGLVAASQACSHDGHSGADAGFGQDAAQVGAFSTDNDAASGTGGSAGMSVPAGGAGAGGRRADAAAPDVARGPSDAGGLCLPGALCSAGAVCSRACTPGRAVRCQCIADRFFCTGCDLVDAGGDTRDYPSCPRNMSVAGRSCDDRGAVCDYATEAGVRLCVCADLGHDRQWVCQ
jgi:hypothetical protein